MSAPVVIEVIEHCWTRIEPYLDIISLISVSKSCNKLRQLVIDGGSGKLKASILEVPPYLKDDCPYGPISEHGPRLLNLVHFPSLKRLNISFPELTTRRSSTRISDENNYPLAFPLFASLVENAYNLEYLSIDVGNVIVYEDGGRPQLTYNILKSNLIHCKKLKRLVISNGGGPFTEFGKYSPTFFAAMVPVIQAGILSLESVNLECGGEPISSDYPDALYDFFMAVFSLQNLKGLAVMSIPTISGDNEGLEVMKSLLNASRSIEETLGGIPSKSLRGVRLMIIAGKSKEPLSLQLNHLLSLLSKESLTWLMMFLPHSCWNGNISALRRYILDRSSSLNVLLVDLEGYKDSSGNLLSFMQKVIKESSDTTTIKLLRMGYLAEQDDSFQALGQFVEKKETNGETTWEFGYKPDKGDTKASA